MTGSGERSAAVSRQEWTRRQLLASGAGASLAAFVLGCDVGGGNDAGKTQGASGADGEVVPGGIFRMGTDYAGTSVNPFTQSYSLYPLVYPQMTKLGFEGKVEGWLAESWKRSRDGLTWTFRLKEGKWSDGQPLTAEDVLWTANVQRNYGIAPSSLGYALDGVESVEAPDARTFVAKLGHPRSDLAYRFCFFFVIPKHVYETYDKGNDGKGIKAYRPEEDLPVVSAGPFTFTKVDHKGTSVLTRTSNTFLGKPSAEAVGVVYFENQDAMARALREGDIDLMQVKSGRLAKQIEETDGFVVASRPGDALRTLAINSNPKKTSSPELADPSVRRAFSLAINRDQLVEVVYAGRATVLRGIVAPAQPQWEDPKRAAPVYDPEQANQLLDDAGYERGSDGIRRNRDGEPMSYALLGYDSFPTRMFDLVANDAEAIGVELRPERSDYTTWAERLAKGDYLDFDLTLAGDSGANVTDDYNFSIHTCGAIEAGNSHSSFCNPTYDKLFEQQGREADPNKRRELIWQMERLLVDEERVVIPLVVPDNVWAHSDKWAGINLWNIQTHPVSDSLPSVHMVAG